MLKIECFKKTCLDARYRLFRLRCCAIHFVSSFRGGSTIVRICLDLDVLARFLSVVFLVAAVIAEVR